MTVRRRFAFAALFIISLIAVAALAGPVKAAGGGAVANSCAVKAEVMVARQARGGIHPYWLKCGEAMGNLKWATVHGHPFYVRVAGGPMICLKPGQKFYPNNAGLDRTAVITPTVRCR